MICFYCKGKNVKNISEKENVEQFLNPILSYIKKEVVSSDVNYYLDILKDMIEFNFEKFNRKSFYDHAESIENFFKSPKKYPKFNPDSLIYCNQNFEAELKSILRTYHNLVDRYEENMEEEIFEEVFDDNNLLDKEPEDFGLQKAKTLLKKLSKLIKEEKIQVTYCDKDFEVSEGSDIIKEIKEIQ